MVYVLSVNKNPLMPCRNVIARLLLKDGKAKVVRREPFTIRLLYETTEYTQPLTLGVTPGSGVFGTAVVTDDGRAVYTSEVEVRNNIKKKMDRRREYRRTRRNRKTRYRKPRFLNRANSRRTDRFSPTLQSKIQSHVREIEFIKKILPVTRTVIQSSKFDPALMKNPWLALSEIRPWGYQKGPNYGFANVRAMVLARDKYMCQICGKKNERIDVHHIVYRSENGADDHTNLVALCHSCHVKLHNNKLSKKDMEKLKGRGSKKGGLTHATQMNSIVKQLKRRYPEAIETFGFITKENGFRLGITRKDHHTDACIVATAGNPCTFLDEVVLKRCTAMGDYRKTKGLASEIPNTITKICGMRRYDKVRYHGTTAFIMARNARGYAVLMDINGNKLKFSHLPRGFKTPKMSLMKRLQARSNCMVQIVKEGSPFAPAPSTSE